ncbi:MAG: hypothetical protein ACREFS_09540, partial [Acetobacteraceae bacterium]
MRIGLPPGFLAPFYSAGRAPGYPQRPAPEVRGRFAGPWGSERKGPAGRCGQVVLPLKFAAALPVPGA